MPPFQVIGLDADDTLWHTERLYVDAQAKLKALLARYVAEDTLEARLYATEMRNLEHFGYGIKAFALSMIETAIEISDGKIAGEEIQQIINTARAMLVADIELMDHVDESLVQLAEQHALMLITKGDLRDQETKLARSGLAEHFRYVEIVSDKSRETYESILSRHGVKPEAFVMIGNSLPSDILPVLELGGYAIYIPHELTWAHDAAQAPAEAQPRFHQLEHFGQIPDLIAELEKRAAPAS